MFDLGEVANRVSNTFQALPSFKAPTPMGQLSAGLGPITFGTPTPGQPSSGAPAPGPISFGAGVPGGASFGGFSLGPLNFGGFGLGPIGFGGFLPGSSQLNTDGTKFVPPPPATSTAAPTTGQASTLTGGGSANVMKWQNEINSASQEFGVPADVIAGIMHIESGGDPRAQSTQGATGLMQVMPFHFQPMENAFDPSTNINRGTQLLAQNYDKYRDWNKAAAAYFGAVDANGNPTTSTDATGTNGMQYVQKFNDARALYQAVNSPPKTQWQQVAEAQMADLTGKPYHYGGKDPTTGFDCSGFVSWVFGQQGVHLTPQTQWMFNETAPVDAAPQPGDLVFFNMSDPDPHIQHVGIYMGNGQFINDTDYGGKSGVQISDLRDWANQSPTFRRVPGLQQ